MYTVYIQILLWFCLLSDKSILLTSGLEGHDSVISSNVLKIQCFTLLFYFIFFVCLSKGMSSNTGWPECNYYLIATSHHALNKCACPKPIPTLDGAWRWKPKQYICPFLFVSTCDTVYVVLVFFFITKLWMRFCAVLLYSFSLCLPFYQLPAPLPSRPQTKPLLQSPLFRALLIQRTCAVSKQQRWVTVWEIPSLSFFSVAVWFHNTGAEDQI